MSSPADAGREAAQEARAVAKLNEKERVAQRGRLKQELESFHRSVDPVFHAAAAVKQQADGDGTLLLSERSDLLLNVVCREA